MKTIRLLHLIIGGTDWMEIWVGIEYSVEQFEARLELNLWRLEISLPIMWRKKEEVSKL